MRTGLHRGLATGLACAIAALGVALVASTAWHGGGTNGFVIGALFLGLGAGRLYLLRRR